METEKNKTVSILNKSQVLPIWTINFTLIFLSSLSLYISFHMLVPTLPIYILEFGGTKEATGMALGFLTLAAVISRPIAGWALDNLGRKAIYMAGLVFFLLPTLVYLLIIPVSLLLAFRFIQGLGWGMGNTAAGTIASDIVPKERMGEGMGFFNLTNSISLAISPAIGLWLINQYSFKTLFVVCCVLNGLAILLGSFVKYPRLERQSKRTKLVFLEKSALAPSMVILFIAMTYSSIMSFIALFALEQGIKTSSLFFTTLALVTLISRPLGGRIVDRMGGPGYNLVAVSGILAIIMAMATIAQTSSLVHLIIGGIFYGIGFGFIQPSMLTLSINSVAINKKGAANATYWTSFDIGVSAGSVIWGIVAGAFGYSIMFFSTTLTGTLALIFYLTNLRQNK